MDTAGNLSIAMAPVMLDAFHVPLVNEYDYLLSLGSVYLRKEILVSLVNEDLLELGEENVSTLDEPVHRVHIEALFRESLWANKSKLRAHFLVLVRIEGASILESLECVLRQVHPCLMQKPLPGLLASFWSKELELGAYFVCRLACKLDFKARPGPIAIIAEPEVQLPYLCVKPQSRQEKPLPIAPVVINPLEVTMLI